MAYEDILTQIGLSGEEAKVYEALLKLGPVPASDIPLETALSRPLVYKILDELFEKRIIDRDETKKVTRFVAAHPAKLAEMVENRKKALVSAEASLSGIMGQMVSAYNLFSGKPNVRFFEGLDGIDRLLDDCLTATEPICCYMNDESILKYAPKIDVEHQKKCEKHGVQKKIIFLEKEGFKSPDAPFYPEWIQAKIIETPRKEPFQTIIQIYNGKISYMTILSEREMIGVIIDDKYAYELHRFLFETQWNTISSMQRSSGASLPKPSQTPE